MSYLPTPNEKDGLRRYGYHFDERIEDVLRCAYSVTGSGFGDRPHQCQRKRGHGPDGLYCKQHAPESVKARQEASTKAWNDRMARSPQARLGQAHVRIEALLEALRSLKADVEQTDPDCLNSQKKLVDRMYRTINDTLRGSDKAD